MTENPKHPEGEPTHDHERVEPAPAQPAAPAEHAEESEDGGALDLHNSEE